MTTQQQSLRGTHDAQCAEQIRVRELVRVGEAEPDVVVLHRIAEQIQACCGIHALKAHRRAWGWTVERAVERFHAMCAEQGLGARGLVARSWQGWEAGDGSPNDDYRDLLCRLFQTSAVRLGFASDHTPQQVAAVGCDHAAPEPASAALVSDVNSGPRHQPGPAPVLVQIGVGSVTLTGPAATPSIGTDHTVVVHLDSGSPLGSSETMVVEAGPVRVVIVGPAEALATAELPAADRRARQRHLTIAGGSAKTFGEAVRRLSGAESLRSVARRAHLDPAHLSRMVRGVRPPTRLYASALDTAFSTDELVALVGETPANLTGRAG